MILPGLSDNKRQISHNIEGRRLNEATKNTYQSSLDTFRKKKFRYKNIYTFLERSNMRCLRNQEKSSSNNYIKINTILQLKIRLFLGPSKLKKNE